MDEDTLMDIVRSVTGIAFLIADTSRHPQHQMQCHTNPHSHEGKGRIHSTLLVNAAVHTTAQQCFDMAERHCKSVLAKEQKLPSSASSDTDYRHMLILTIKHK